MNARNRTLAVLVALLIVAFVAAGCGGGEKAKQELYTCPMHPTYVAEGPGTCPICNMDLVPQSSLAPGAEPAGAASTHADVALSEAGRKLAGVVTDEARREALSVLRPRIVLS